MADSEQRRPDLATAEPAAELEIVARFDGPMPTGVTVSREGWIFVNVPKWGDDVCFTVAEVRDGQPVAYPNQAFNDTNDVDPAAGLVSVQSVVVAPADRLWILDTGSPLFKPTRYGGPKLVSVDLATDTVAKTILFPPNVALPTTYLNDVRFDTSGRSPTSCSAPGSKPNRCGSSDRPGRSPAKEDPDGGIRTLPGGPGGAR